MPQEFMICTCTYNYTRCLSNYFVLKQYNFSNCVAHTHARAICLLVLKSNALTCLLQASIDSHLSTNHFNTEVLDS